MKKKNRMARTFGDHSPLSPPVLNKPPVLQEKKKKNRKAKGVGLAQSVGYATLDLGVGV